MKRLHRIGNSKVPTIDQLERMVQNLRKAYPKSYCCISSQITGYTTGTLSTKYWLDVEGIYNQFIPSWSQTLNRYRKLIKESKNV